MIELLFLLLPVAAAYGYLMGRNAVNKANRESSDKIANHYYKGLNFLLSDEKDKAVDTLIKMMDSNNQHWDTQIAMGKLFRQRGELDRAIRLHQNIVVREGLTLQQKSSALNELAIDYLQAGFLERAEESFLHLLNETDYSNNAVSELLQIYQTTKDWTRGIALYEDYIRHQPQTTDNIRQVIGHFYCEMASSELVKDNYKVAINWLKGVVEISPYPIRSLILLNKLYMAQKNYQSAYMVMLSIIKKDIIWCSELASDLLLCAHETKQSEQLYLTLEEYSEKSTSAYLLQARLLKYSEGDTAARAFLLTKLRVRPSVKGFEALLAGYSNKNSITEESVTEIQALLKEQMLARPTYRCDNCGFSTKTLYWQCPSCRQWDTVKPIRGLDGD